MLPEITLAKTMTMRFDDWPTLNRLDSAPIFGSVLPSSALTQFLHLVATGKSEPDGLAVRPLLDSPVLR